MNESDSGLHKGARPKAKPISAVNNGVEPPCSDNNNSHRSLYSDESLANERLASDSNEPVLLSRPCGSGLERSPRPLSLDFTEDPNLRWRPYENGGNASSSQTSGETTVGGRAHRPSVLSVNGFSEAVSSSPSNTLIDSISLSENLPESVVDGEFSVLPRELLQDSADYCGLNGDCDLCGSRSIDLEACSLNRVDDTNNPQELENGAHGLERSGIPNVEAQGKETTTEQEDELEGAVGGERVPSRCSSDSGEGEFENQNSRSPSCSWDQQSSSSNEECFYRYRGEDDNIRNPAVNENIPNRANGQNEARRRSSSPEMDYLEMDFDPSSSDWGGDDARPLPAAPQADIDLGLMVAPPPQPLPPPQPAPIQVARISPPPEELLPPRSMELELPVPAIARGNVMLWTQSFASELTHPFTTPLTSASNAIFYTMTALGHPVSRESVVAHLTEAHPIQAVPQTLVGYLVYRASHTCAAPYSSFPQPTLILTGPDLARAIRNMSRDQLRARFFPIASRQLLESGNLCNFITTWLHRGVVPILTFSQAASEGSRHEMVFGSNEGGILTMGEPYRTMGEVVLSNRLAGQGQVAVRHSEILARWGREQDLRPLLQSPSLAWSSHNILGSVVSMLREAATPSASPSPTSPCSSRQPQPQPLLQLPLLCESGVTLVCTNSNPSCQLLENCSNINH